ncbi:M23 family metallopeptidase [Tamlana haliotis]|uniref:M23 family metallopeptidase n=1 Tax=Pseudotamlana haliotis TaxID=2614804 RepID=A0A6N6MDZ2_9FLAO|nr:M23 family metallopeptidase [Tamlana haliotis]KAB1067950.1 M23 family metallopeptidase [Tamlana haliotis]
MKVTIIGIVSLILFSCNNKGREVEAIVKNFDKKYYANGFDYPVGKPDADNYYNAQSFRKNNHLGDDWNGVGGGNTDLGDPIYAISKGYVSYAEEVFFAWGNVIRIVHILKNGEMYESMYAHCDEILVTEGMYVEKGDKIGTIGTANGKYLAHLHFEIRDEIGMEIGSGYDINTRGYLDPTEFINTHR